MAPPRGARPDRRRPLRRAKNAVIYYVVAAGLRALGLLPHRVAVALGRALGGLAWLVARRERRRALANVIRAGVAPDRRAATRLVRRVFVSLGRSAMECAVMHRLRPRLGAPASPVRFAGESRSVLAKAVGAGRGVIYVTAHFGNWELMAAAVARVAPVTVLYKPSYDVRFTRMIVAFREQNGVQGIDVTAPGHFRQAARALRQGAILGVLVDQPVPRGVPVPFFGHPAPTSTLVGALAARTGASVVTGFIRREDPCHHAITIRRITPWRGAGAPVQGAHCATEAVEAIVRGDPEQWTWSLDRWRSPLERQLSSQTRPAPARTV